MRLVFGAYEPDKPPFLSNALTTAQNVYPATAGYRPVGQFAAQSSALASQPLGAATFVSPDGTTTIFACTATNIYRFQTSSWTSIGSGYTMPSNGRWRFAQFGGIAVATNGVDAPQKINLTGFTVANLGGSPPTFEMLTVVKDFLVGGVVGGNVNQIQWSAINNAEGWTVGLNQCDYQIIPSGGEVTGLLGGEFGIILQRGRVSRMTYVGNNLVFQFDEISNTVGCVSPHSVVQAGQMGFWLSDAGFIMWDGATLIPIGQEVVDRTFTASYTNIDWETMSTAVDIHNNLVAWAMHDRIFVYNWVLKRWSIISLATSIVFSGFSRALTLEEVAALYPNLDTMPVSLDSPVFKGGNPLFYVFDSTNTLGTLSGPTMPATIATGDLELAPGRDARLSSVRPLTDAVSGLTITVGSRARLGDTLNNNAYAAEASSGDIETREAARYMRLTQTINAGTAWTFTEGLDLTLHAGARR